MTMFVSVSKPAPSCVTSLATIMSALLRASFAAGVFGDAIGFRGEANENADFFAGAAWPSSARMSGVGSSSSVKLPRRV